MTTLWNIAGLNADTQKVINYMSGRKTEKQIVWEFFWLREEAVYDDNWENIVDYVNDFKDIKVLEQKKVQYNDKLKELWVTEEKFNSLFRELPNPANFKIKPIKEDGKTDWGKQDNTWNTWKTKKK